MAWDDEGWHLVQKHLPQLSELVDPAQMLPHLTCLTPFYIDRIQARQNHEGATSTVMYLYDALRRQGRKGYVQLVNALRHPNIGLEDLADLIDPFHHIPVSTPTLSRVSSVSCTVSATPPQTPPVQVNYNYQQSVNINDSNYIQIGEKAKMTVSIDPVSVPNEEPTQSTTENSGESSTPDEPETVGHSSGKREDYECASPGDRPPKDDVGPVDDQHPSLSIINHSIKESEILYSRLQSTTNEDNLNPDDTCPKQLPRLNTPQAQGSTIINQNLDELLAMRPAESADEVAYITNNLNVSNLAFSINPQYGSHLPEPLMPNIVTGSSSLSTNRINNSSLTGDWERCETVVGQASTSMTESDVLDPDQTIVKVVDTAVQDQELTCLNSDWLSNINNTTMTGNSEICDVVETVIGIESEIEDDVQDADETFVKVVDTAVQDNELTCLNSEWLSEMKGGKVGDFTAQTGDDEHNYFTVESDLNVSDSGFEQEPQQGMGSYSSLDSDSSVELVTMINVINSPPRTQNIQELGDEDLSTGLTSSSIDQESEYSEETQEKWSNDDHMNKVSDENQNKIALTTVHLGAAQGEEKAMPVAEEDEHLSNENITLDGESEIELLQPEENISDMCETKPDEKEVRSQPERGLLKEKLLSVGPYFAAVGVTVLAVKLIQYVK